MLWQPLLGNAAAPANGSDSIAAEGERPVVPPLLCLRFGKDEHCTRQGMTNFGPWEVRSTPLGRKIFRALPHLLAPRHRIRR